MIRKIASGFNAANARPSCLIRIAFACLIWGMGSSLASGADLIYVSLSNHTIETYDVSLSSAAAIQSSRSVFANTDLNDPYGLAFDNAGNLFAANYYDGTIAKFTSNG